MERDIWFLCYLQPGKGLIILAESGNKSLGEKPHCISPDMNLRN